MVLSMHCFLFIWVTFCMTGTAQTFHLLYSSYCISGSHWIFILLLESLISITIYVTHACFFFYVFYRKILSTQSRLQNTPDGYRTITSR
jgi:hypothetical protein